MIDLSQLFLFEVTPPLAYSVGVFMLVNCFLVSLQARWQLQPCLGFRKRSKALSFAMLLVALWLFIRGMTIFWSASVNVNVILLSLFFFVWRSLELCDYYQRSKAALA